jgi:cytochrome c oxidase cbb3-type subunit 3
MVQTEASLRLNWKTTGTRASLAVLALVGGVLLAANVAGQRERMWGRLLRTLPDQVVADPQLVGFAMAQARPLYGEHCAGCHGAKLQGNPALGAPNLADSTWLYGAGSVYDIERTLLYGIRTGRSKAHAITDMPAFGLTGRLSDGEIRNVVQYVLQISGNNYDAPAANEGRAIFHGKADCTDCHGMDARGDSGYGAPDLTRNVWNSGGDAASLYTAVYSGQHHVMPAWLGTLSLQEIRALAVYVYCASHPTSDRSDDRYGP